MVIVDSPANSFMCSFVIVWDKPHADRTKVLSPGFNTPFFTFAGEMLDEQPSGPTQETRVKVRGNCFACHARDVEDVKQKMRLTSYYKEVSLSIAFILFLLNLSGHSGHLGHIDGADLATGNCAYQQI